MGYHLKPLGSYTVNPALYGLGSAAPVNSEEARTTSVETGWFASWLDTALEPIGIPSDQASRVPTAIRAVLESVGSEVDRVVWGGGSGLESIRGKVYVRWKPDKEYNAVDYANIARRLFQHAAEGFPAGAQFVMNRYRIDRMWPRDDVYVYPLLSRGLPPSAPEAARATNVTDLPAPVEQPEGDGAPESDFDAWLRDFESGWKGLKSEEQAGIIVGSAAGLVLVVGGIWYAARRAKRVAKNRRRRLSRRRRR